MKATTEIPDSWKHIVGALADKLLAPSDDIPNVRWMSRRSLIHLLGKIRSSSGAPKTLSGVKMLNTLAACNLAQKLQIDSVPPGKSPFSIYCLDLGDVPAVTPMELLVATQSDFKKTAICYFTAIQFHELTTQVAPHHHIAVLKQHPQSHVVSSQTGDPPSLGTRLFTFEGTPYYVTMRDRLLIPGVQTVRITSHFQVRVTTLEQTLLDTLHRPWSCGGPSVVFEAWERGTPIIDDARLAQYLSELPNPDLIRRVGYLLEQNGHAVADAGLKQMLLEAKRCAQAGGGGTVPLLPNTPSQTLNSKWGLYV